MADFQDQDFSGQTVQLDGNNYDRCKFGGAKLIYSGGKLPNMRGCRFHGGNFVLEGPAGRTLIFLQALSREPTLIGLIHQFFGHAFEKGAEKK